MLVVRKQSDRVVVVRPRCLRVRAPERQSDVVVELALAHFPREEGGWEGVRVRTGMKEEEGTAGALVGVVAVTNSAGLASFSPLNFPTYLTHPRVSLIGSAV